MNLAKILAISVVLSTSTAVAEVIVDLPELSGDYSIGGPNSGTPPSGRATAIFLPSEIESFEGLMFVASGPWTMGLYESCREIPPGITVCDTLPYWVNLTLRITSDAIGECEYLASTVAANSVDGDELLVEFCEEGQADINDLLGSEVSIELFCNVSEEDVPNIVQATFGTLIDVHLEVLGTVPVSPSSWGRVKSMYR